MRLFEREHKQFRLTNNFLPLSLNTLKTMILKLIDTSCALTLPIFFAKNLALLYDVRLNTKKQVNVVALVMSI